jgi:DNA-binding beta-propeller fold protein YncE
MRFRLRAAALVAAFLLGIAPRHHTMAHHPVAHLGLTVYSAPAGTRPTEVSAQRNTAGILPDGRITAPVGKTIFVGTNPQGVALSPDDRFAIVSNDDSDANVRPHPGTGGLVSGYSLTVVNTASMRVADVYHDPNATFYAGIAAVRDPRNPAQTLVFASDGAHDLMRVFDLGTAGRLTPERTIPLPSPSRPGYAGDHRAFPSSIVISRDGRVAYVVESLGEAVAAIDIASRSVLGEARVGIRPFAIALAGGRLYVADAGLSDYRVLATPSRVPQFGLPDIDPDRASSLAIVPLSTDEALATNPDAVSFLRLDRVPDGTQNVGGIIPSAVVTRRDGGYAYVALSNVDRVVTVTLRGKPRTVHGLDLRLFPDAPYGTQPSSEVLSPNDTRLYVALSGINAVAVLDARHPAVLHRLGLIPTGWYPSALAISRNGRYLYITDAEGLHGWGMLQRVDLRRFPLGPATLSALRYNRNAAFARPNALVPPLRSRRRSDAIAHVFYLSVGVDSYDAVLGDLTDAQGRRHGNGDPSYVAFGESVTPNLHALAREFALADNVYAPRVPAIAIQLATAAGATLPVERDAPLADARTPFKGYGEDPEEYPRAGFLFNSLERANETFRDYGGLEQVSGYRDGLYDFDVPLLAALSGSVDTNYAAMNPHVTDEQRAREFASDFDSLVNENRVPNFTYVWLPTVPGGEADADRAIGTIVDTISHAPQWTSSAIFIVPDSVQLFRDHVDGSRIYAVVVSPYAKRGFVYHEHLSIASVVKTEDEILGLPPLSIGDLLASDLAPCFTPKANTEPFQASPAPHPAVTGH